MILNQEVSEYLSEEKIQKRVKELGLEISKKYQKQGLTVIAVLNGSFIFFSDLVRHLELDIKTDFIGMSSYGSATQSSGEVKLTLDLSRSIKGENVLLIEDIVDTGLTIDHLIKTLKVREPKSIEVATLLFKKSALKHPVKPDYVGFEITNEFVVGYGLDFNERYRQLPYIGVIQSLN